MRPAAALLAFLGAIAVFHHLPVAFHAGWHEAVDLITPFPVLAAAVLLLVALEAGERALVAAFVGAILYTDGHGMHLAGNAINVEGLHGHVGHLANFWDERWGHFEWHTGWFTLLAAACLADLRRSAPAAVPPRFAAAAIVLLGGSLFADTVEGGTWWLELGATVVFAAWAVRARRPFLATVAGGFALAAALIGIWAAWHGGMPQFSDLGWLSKAK
ncbi:MAG: hypothetical protein QOE36_2496 [Gaiellaceae bacterium]|jgi:hypothetical protein|nr:hypothetical protein [Gaiellaceae bacterium]